MRRKLRAWIQFSFSTQLTHTWTYLSLNILDDAHYEQMLRLVWGGWIAALWSAPHLGASDSNPAPSSLITDMACRNRALLAAVHARGAAVGWDASPEDLLDPKSADMLCSWNATCCNVAGCAWTSTCRQVGFSAPTRQI